MAGTTVTVEVDSVDVSHALIEESLKIQSQITSRIDTCQLSLDASRSPAPSIEDKDEVIVERVSDSARIFGGYIADIDLDVEGIRKIYNITAQDYTVLPSRVIVNEVYEAKTTAYIINDLFTNYLPEIDGSTYVDTGLTLDKIIFYRVSLADALNELAKQNGMDWYIDYNKKLHFFATPSTSSIEMSSSPDNVTSFPFYKLKYRRDGSNVINMQSVLGGHYKSDDSDHFLAGDGTQTEFLLPYKLSAPDGETGILVYHNTGSDVSPNWVADDVGIDFIDELGVGGIDVLYNYQEKLLKFNTAPSQLELAVKVTGQYDIPILVRSRNQDSYDDYGRWFEGRPIVNNQIDTKDWALLVAKAVLAEHAFVKERGDFRTNKDGMVVGEKMRLVESIRGIDDYYLIHKITARIIGHQTIEYKASYGEYNKDLIDILLELRNNAKEYHDILDNETLMDLFQQVEALSLAETPSRYEDDRSAAYTRILPNSVPADGITGMVIRNELFPLTEGTASVSTSSAPYTWNNFNWDFGTWG